MSELVPGLEQHCIDSANEHARRSHRRRRAWRLRTPLMAVLFGLTLTGGAYAVDALWKPTFGDGNRAPATASYGQPPATLSAVLSVLRTPQTAADRGTATQYAARYQDATKRGIRTSSFRLLGATPAGEDIVLFAVDHLDLRNRPGLERVTIDNALCIWVRDSADIGGSSCIGPEGLMQGGLLATSVGPDGVTLVGVAPDGVDRVVISPPVGESKTVSVRNNWFTTVVTSVPRTLPIWIDSDGHRIGPRAPANSTLIR